MVRNRGLDALVYLQGTEQSQSANQNQNIKNGRTRNRSASVAGGGLFSINNRIREAGFDYFPPVLSNVVNNLARNAPDMATITTAMVSTSKNNDVSNNTNAHDANVGTISIAANKTNDNNSTPSTSNIENNEIAGIDSNDTQNETSETNDDDDGNDMESFKENVMNIQNVIPLHNNFDPYRRLPNVPFNRKQRANSLFERSRPSLSSITEEDMQIPETNVSEKDAASMRKWMNIVFK